MKKIALATFLTFGVGLAAQAQVSIGPKVGVNLSNVRQNLEDNDGNMGTKMLLRPVAGLVNNAQISDLLSIQPQILYSGKGYGLDLGNNVDGYARSVYNYVEVPVNIVLGFGDPDRFQFQVFAGPYAAFAISGKNKIDFDLAGVPVKEDEEIEFGSDGDDDMRQLDYGVNAGLGFRAGPVQVQAGYGLGLANLFPDDEFRKENSLSNGVIHLSAAFLFGGR